MKPEENEKVDAAIEETQPQMEAQSFPDDVPEAEPVAPCTAETAPSEEAFVPEEAPAAEAAQDAPLVEEEAVDSGSAAEETVSATDASAETAIQGPDEPETAEEPRTEEPASEAVTTSPEEPEPVTKRHLLPVALTAAALIVCCAVLSVLWVLGQKEPQKIEMVRTQKFMSREMPTIPTEPPTEPPTEAPTEPPYEMKLDIANAQSCHAVNEDVVGWVYIDGTVIDYPVVQADDNSYYMERNWQKQYSYSGSIFQDYECELATTENTLLYGHNMGNGTMFHAIKNYKVEDWGLEHPYVEVCNLETRYLYRVISVNVLYGNAGAAFEYWNCKTMSSASYASFVQQIYDTSLVWYGGEALPEYGDEILTLQTCNSGAADGMRCVLFAVRVGEY